VAQPQQEQPAVVQQVGAVRVELAALRGHARRQDELPLLVARAPVACNSQLAQLLTLFTIGLQQEPEAVMSCPARCACTTCKAA
jgi:hypothetical protein